MHVQMFIHGFLAFYKVHSMQVLYTDGDEEILNLKKERWEYIDDDSESERVGGCVNLYFSCHLRSS